MYISDTMLFHNGNLVGVRNGTTWSLAIGSGHKRFSGRESAVRDPRLFEALVDERECNNVLLGSEISNKLRVLYNLVVILANRSPDAVYNHTTCLYNEGECGTGCGCIMGQALKIMGVPESTLEVFDRSIPHIIQVLDRLEWTETGSGRILTQLREIQSRQDGGMPWKECINGLL